MIILVTLLVLPCTGISQIVSAPGGGFWNTGSTWIGGNVPGVNDSVVIASDVMVNGGSCAGLYVTPVGILGNSTTSTHTLVVVGGLTNDGIIKNAGSYNFNLIISGNVSNNGVWSNRSTRLNGVSNQEISATQPFSGYEFFKDATSGSSIVTTGISFIGTLIDFFNDTLAFTTGSSISIEGGYIYRCILYKETLPALDITMSDGAYFNLNNEVNAPEINLFDTVMVRSSNTFKGVVNNYGVLRNLHISNNILDIDGDLINHSNIENNSLYNFTVNITGNITNYGEWSNRLTRLNGTSSQEIAATQPFTGYEFLKSATAGNAIATTGISFIGTFIDFFNDTLAFTTGSSISIEGGYISRCILYKETLPALDITMSDGAYFNLNCEVNAPEINLFDAIMIRSSNTFKGVVNNHGVLRNLQLGSYTLDIVGDLINHSIIENNSLYNFIVNITGNITNNGEWSNRTTRLTGASNQEISATHPFTGYEFLKNATTGSAIATTGISFSGTIIDFLNDTLTFTTGSSISLEGGYIYRCSLHKETLPSLDITMTDGAFFYLTNTVNAPEINLLGTTLIGGTTTFTGTVSNNGILGNRQVGNFILDIEGSLYNDGTIRNIGPYSFTVNITESIANHGEWSNRTTRLTGTSNQEIAATLPFSGYEFLKNATTGSAIAITGISFSGTIIDFLNDTLAFTTGSSISLEGGYIYRCSLHKETLPSLDITMTDGAFFYLTNTVNAPEINLLGTTLIGGTTTFTGTVSNDGILGNRPVSNYILDIEGNLYNYGTIRNIAPYTFTLNITGSISNHGNWTNQNTNLNGPADHSLAFTKKFGGKNFANTNSSADMISTTDMIFDGADINLNGGLLMMPEKGLISVQNGYMINATIEGTDVHFHGSNSYCQTVTFNTNLTTHGDVRLRTGVLFSGNLVNEGSLGNSSNSNYETTVSGTLMNNGNIANQGLYQFRLNVLGDIYNNGSWINQWTLLDGITDQNIFIQNSSSIVGQIRLDANFTGSGLNWYGPSGSLIGNPDFSGANALQLNFLNPVTDLDAGEYYCYNSLNEQSRSIFINTMSTTFNELDLMVNLEGAFNGTDMNTSLNSGGFLPLDQPYFDFPWVYPGVESVGAIPSADVVDWVLVELRDAASPVTATNSERVARYSGFLLKNGKVVGPDGTSNIEFSEEITDNLYVVIRHRNHLEIMSATALTENPGVYSYDFSSGSGQAYGTDAQAEVATGVWGMISGDGDGYGSVDLTDNVLWGHEAGNSGYYRSDYDLGGEVNNQDKNDTWFSRLGLQSQVPE